MHLTKQGRAELRRIAEEAHRAARKAQEREPAAEPGRRALAAIDLAELRARSALLYQLLGQLRGGDE